jgi:hypothetical protein
MISVATKVLIFLAYALGSFHGYIAGLFYCLRLDPSPTSRQDLREREPREEIAENRCGPKVRRCHGR